jgi:hypothetical protein
VEDKEVGERKDKGRLSRYMGKSRGRKGQVFEGGV